MVNSVNGFPQVNKDLGSFYLNEFGYSPMDIISALLVQVFKGKPN